MSTTDKIPFKISSLIARKLAAEITEDEQSELDRWINTSPANRSIFEITIDPKTKVERDRFVQSINVQEDWLTVKDKLSTSAKNQIHMHWYRIAAAILIVAAALGVFFSQWFKPQSREAFEQEIARIVPGTAQATVKLHNGETILLSEAHNQNKSFEETNGAALYNANGSVSYRQGQNNAGELIYNEISVPRGGEYKLVLSDGTQVWLNSETRIVFPVQFITDERVVEVSGEAYFEVAHDSKKPFIVNTLKEAKIQVYGTSFNINAYADNREVAVTLSEGKVALSKKGNAKVFLKPDQQAIVNAGADISVNNVDASSFAAWKDGLLVFDNLSMEEIAKLLSRWYDVDFKFEDDKVKNFRFSADIKRYATFRDVLKIFEKTGQLSFEVHGKTINVVNRQGV
jgi:transmembrane sensor